jgi:putative Mn2+ efflux pump MntP
MRVCRRRESERERERDCDSCEKFITFALILTPFAVTFVIKTRLYYFAIPNFFSLALYVVYVSVLQNIVKATLGMCVILYILFWKNWLCCAILMICHPTCEGE